MKVLGNQRIKLTDVQIGDKIAVPLKDFGEFTATAHKVTDKDVLFIFDECVAKVPINHLATNEGGFEKSDLKTWMDTVLIESFPYELKSHILELTIPTVGQIFGHEDEWNNKVFEIDTDEQLPLMNDQQNRIALLGGISRCWWLRNATKKQYSLAFFAYVYFCYFAACNNAVNSLGIRPEFLLRKD